MGVMHEPTGEWAASELNNARHQAAAQMATAQANQAAFDSMNIRAVALQQAVQSCSSYDVSPEAVVKAAKAFEEYLRG